MSTNIRTLRPVLRIGQRTDPSREFTLAESDGKAKSIDLTNATRVTLTMEHYTRAFTAVSDGECTIVNPKQGVVEYSFSTAETSVYGRYYVQFEVTWDDGSKDLIPPSGYEWVLDIGRRQPDTSPLEVPRIYADEGVFGTLEVDQATMQSLAGLGAPTGESVTDLYGQNLYYEAGRLNAFDPAGTGEVFDHMHTGTAGDGGSIGASGTPAAPAHIQSVTLTDPVDETSAPERSATKAYVEAGLDDVDISSWNWIDVTRHGIDNTGATSVVADINALVADNTLLIFPPGDYYVPADQTITTTGATKNFGMVGRGDARFVHAADSVNNKWLTVRGPTSTTEPIENFVFSNLTTDFSALNCGRGTTIVTSGQSRIENFRQVGHHDSNLAGGGSLAVRSIGEDTILDVINPRLPDGSAYHATQSQQAFGIFVGEESTGTVRIKDAYIEGFADNGVYGSRANGPVIVEGGVYKDNNKNGVRLSSDGSAAYDPTVIIDTPDPNYSAIAINIRDGPGHVTVENPTVEVRNSALGSAAIGDALRVGEDVESATIRGGRIEVASPTRLINFGPTNVGVEDEGVLLEDITFVRTADGAENQHIARCTRNGVVFRDMTIKGRVGGTTAVRGIRINAAKNVKIEGGYFETDDRPLWVDGTADCVIDGIRGAHGTNAIDLNGPDANVVNVSTANVDSWNIRGLRPRWNDIVGGGPFAGIDLSTVHGRANGDIARSDGTATGFPTGSVATWTGGATWIRADGQATVSPP